MTLNLALMKSPATENIPEEFDGSLDCSSFALCCAFNRTGSLLAVGCNDGRVVIWDFLTRGVARNILAHAGHPVPSLSWSRNSRLLATASLDNTIAIWNVLTGECKIRWIFKAPIVKIQFNPRNDNLILLCPHKHPSIIISVDYEKSLVVHKYLPTEKDDSESSMVSSFDRRGEHILFGGMKGRLNIVQCPKMIDENVTFSILSSFKVQSSTGSANATITEIEFGAHNKDYFLLNCSDRAIRLYSFESALKAGPNGICEELEKFQDLINKTMWKRCCLSGDPEASLVCGGSARQHSLYIWESENGTIRKMLQGGKNEVLIDIQWHPLKPIVASVSSGLVSIWARAEIENWSAYAPDFKELEENEEYEERESEFDLEDEDKKEKASKNEPDDDEIEIDVVGGHHGNCIASSDEEEDVDTSTLDFIPISLEDHEMIDLNQH